MTPSDRRSAVVQAFRAPDLEPALTELLVPEELVQARSACDRLRTVEFVVAVLGMQGVGKSLLLNALAGRRVVAVGEDETTNVVVRIRAAGSEGERLVVRFRDGRTERHALREDLVRRYTDELENPGNEAGVEDVTCFLDAPLLQEGIVLADTPGAGSLRAANGQVTQDYLPEVSLGLFVLPTVPTLRKSEVQFLRTTWRHSRDFLYVQNHWHAPARELADALATNRRILTELAQAEGDTRPIVIHAVDVCEALEGACNDQPERVAASGLPALVEALRARLAGGAERVHLATNGRVILQTLERAAATAVHAAHGRVGGVVVGGFAIAVELRAHRGLTGRRRLLHRVLHGGVARVGAEEAGVEADEGEAELVVEKGGLPRERGGIDVETGERAARKQAGDGALDAEGAGHARVAETFVRVRDGDLDGLFPLGALYIPETLFVKDKLKPLGVLLAPLEGDRHGDTRDSASDRSPWLVRSCAAPTLFRRRGAAA